MDNFVAFREQVYSVSNCLNYDVRMTSFLEKCISTGQFFDPIKFLSDEVRNLEYRVLSLCANQILGRKCDQPYLDGGQNGTSLGFSSTAQKL